MKTIIKNSLILATLVAFAASACAPLGKYKKDENVRSDLFGRGVAVADSLPISTIGWKDVFVDPELQVLIQEALDSSKDMKIAYETVQQAKAALSGARMAYVPQLNIVPQGGWGYTQTSGSSYTGWSYDVAANFSWEVDIFGRLANRKDKAKAQVEQSEDYRQAVRVSLIASVASAYYTLLMYDEQLKTSLEMENVWASSVDAIHALKREGFADEVAVSQYEATYSKLRATSSDLRQKIGVTENALSVLIGVPCRSISRTELKMQAIPEKVSVGIPIQILTNRPDVRAAERDVEIAFYTTKDAWLNFYPTLTINGSAALTNVVSGALVPMSFLGNIGAGLVAPIFSAGVNRTKLKVAESQQRVAKINLEKALLNAGMEVNSALIDMKGFREKAQFYDAQVISLVKARDDTELLMNNSQDKTYLDVLAAHNALIEAEFNHISSKANILQAMVNVYSALGGGTEY